MNNKNHYGYVPKEFDDAFSSVVDRMHPYIAMPEMPDTTLFFPEDNASTPSRGKGISAAQQKRLSTKKKARKSYKAMVRNKR